MMIKFQQRWYCKAFAILLAFAILVAVPYNTVPAYATEGDQPTETLNQGDVSLDTNTEEVSGAPVDSTLGTSESIDSSTPLQELATSTEATSTEIELFEADTTPPAFAEGGFPKNIPQSPGSRQIYIYFKAQEASYYHAVLLENNALQPSKEQIMAGNGADGRPAIKVFNNKNKEEGMTIAGFVSQHTTEYDVYVVLRDDAGNLSEPAKVDFPSPLPADLVVSDYPIKGADQPDGSKQVEVKIKLQNINTGYKGKVYWVLLPDGAARPSIEQVAAGTDGNDAAGITSGSSEFIHGNEESFLVTGTTGNTQYDLYMVVGDTNYANPLGRCTDVIELKVTTPVDVDEEKLCETNGTQYATLQEAVANADSTATIKLLKSFTTVQSVTIDKKHITLDLNGYMLTIYTTANEGLKVIDGTLALTGEGELNVSGKQYGVWAKNSTVTVTNATATDTDISGSATGTGVYAIVASKVIVRKNATGAAHGIRAENIYTEVTVNGDVSNSAQIKGAVYSAGQAVVTVKGNVTSEMGYGVHTYGGKITVDKNVSGSHVGAMAEDNGSEIYIKGDLSSANNGAVIDSGNGIITVDGKIGIDTNYITIGLKHFIKNEGISDPAKPGYLKYSESDATGAVWVKDPFSLITVSNATELKAALTNVVGGGIIRLTTNINYTEKIVVDTKSFTLDVGTFTLNLNVSAPGMKVYALELKNGGDLALAGTGEFNINMTGANTSTGVYANAGCLATVTNVRVNVASGSAFGVYADGSGSRINVLGDVEVTGTEGGCGARTWGTGQIRIEGIMTAPVYINLNSVYKAKNSGVVDNGYLKYSAVANGPGIVWVKIASAVCEIVGGAQYDNLTEALAAATSGQTIKLLNDISFDKAVSSDGAIKVDSKTITLDLNGYNLSISNLVGHGLAVVNNASVNVTGTGNLSINAKFAALYVTTSAFSSGGNINSSLESSITVGINAAYQSTVAIQKGSITGASGGIYTTGSNNSVTFNGLITVNGQPTWECHGINIDGNYTGNIVQVGGDINIASGLGAGIYVENGGIVTVGSQYNPASVTSSSGAGIWTRQGSTTSDITVYGDVTGKARAIHATGNADIKVFGDVKSTSTLASVFAVEGMANSGDIIAIDIIGNVMGPNGIKYDGNDGTVTVTGNVTATGSASDTVGVFASYGSVSVTGNVSAPNGIGAVASENGEITIDGVLTGNTYVKVYYVNKTASDKEVITTKEGYHTYMKNSAVVWIKVGAPTTAYLLTLQNGTGGGTYAAGAQVTITANAPVQGKVFDKWTTNNGGSFGDANSASTTFTMPTNAVTITATYKDAPTATYLLTVVSGTGGGTYAAGAQVSITADPPAQGKVFDKWTTNNGGSFGDANSASTTFTMPSNAVTITATYKDAPTVTYLLTVVSGAGGGTYAAGAQVSITADPPAQGKVFDKWTTNNGGSFGDANSASTTFTMPTNAVTITATYKDAIAETYTLTVNGSYVGTSGGGQYVPGTQVSIHAGSRSNYSFAGWTTSGDGSFANANSASTTFIMPNGNATVTANWTYNGGDSGSSGGGPSGSSSSGGSMTTPDTTLPEKKPDQPVKVIAPVTATEGENGAASTVIPDNVITDAITRALAEAKEKGKTKDGISIELNVTMPESVTFLTVTLTQSLLNSLVNEGVMSLKISGYPATISFDKKALAEIQKQSDGNVTIIIKPYKNLTTAAKMFIGSRPVYDITISGVKNGKTLMISAFNGGIATISILYKPSKNEATGYLYGVYVDENGNVNRINHSVYDTNESAILISTGHLFSVYGVGYTEPSAKFTDIGTHWSKESIDYVVSRGLLFGTSETTFAPNDSMTRGMLVMALGKLAGVDVKTYITNSFTDVKAESAYRPYIEWAYQKDVMHGIGNQQFAPDRPITREEIAVIFENYAKAIGYKLPVTREAITYADAFNIGSYYQTAVTAMQQAGIMMGGMNNQFNPKQTTTRAEFCAMLHRYVKLTIDPDTTQGWALNDAGQWLYYMNGKTLTGTQTIDSMRYFFNTDGTLKTRWVKDGDNWRYYFGKKAIVGWVNINHKRYYFTKIGLMISGKWLKIDSKWYYFYADGSLARNIKVDGYEVDKNGERKNNKKNK